MAQSQSVVRENRTTKHRQTTTTEAETQSTDVRTCAECDGQLVTEGTETLCEDCGLIEMEYEIDHGPEWFPSKLNDDQSRVGQPNTVTLHDGGLSTEIGHYRDGQGRKLSGSAQRRLQRLRVQHSRAKFRSKKERNLAYANGEIRRLTSALELPSSVRDRACSLLKRAHDADLAPGRSLDALAAAAVYATCRDDGIPTTPHTVADVARVPRSKVMHMFGVLCRDIDDLAPGLFTPNDHIPRLASDLGLSDAVEQRAHTLACEGADAGLSSGVSPSGFAGGCVYAAVREFDLMIQQLTVADVAESTATTVRSHWQALRDAGLTTV